MLSDQEIKDKVQEFKGRLDSFFFLTFDEEKIFSSYNLHLSSISEDYVELFRLFEKNIQSIISIAKIPIQMSFERTINLMVDDIYRRKQILSVEELIVIDKDDSQHIPDRKTLDQRSHQRAIYEFNEKIKTMEGRSQFWYHSLQFVLQCTTSNTSDKFLQSSRELVNQATLLTWTYIEILLRDYFIRHLNKYPAAVSELVKEPFLRSKFDIKSIPIEKLIENNYDLSQSMGSLLIDNFDFSNIDLIKSIFKALFGAKELALSLNDPDIWKLYNRRNLIVHRGGVIDKKYLSKTSDNLIIGTKLYITPEELATYLEKVTVIAGQLMKTAPTRVNT